MELKEKKYGADVLRKVEKSVLLQVLDLLWREHLSRLEHLRSSVTLRSYGQRDPLNEYKTEGFELFQSLLTKLREQVTAHLIRVEVVKKDQLSAENNETVAKNNKNPTNENQINPKTVEEWGKVGRNELCPCGSGKKYKHCHGKMN